MHIFADLAKSLNRSTIYLSGLQVSISPLDVVQFVSGGFVPMNEICERAGMSENQIFDRTKAVFEYFNLPFDLGM